MKLIVLYLYLVVSLFAQTETINIIGGGGDGTDGSGNIDGTGVHAAVKNPNAVAKSHDNQLIVVDASGIKKVNISTNAISTLFHFPNDSSSTYDVEVDSNGNIYAAVSTWTLSDGDGCSAYSKFHDQRIYKISSTGSLITSWGVSNCSTDPNDPFNSSAISLAIDENNVVYAISAFTPGVNGSDYSTEQTYIQRLNSDGSFTMYFDLITIDKDMSGIYALEYYNSKFYFSHNRSIYTFDPSLKTIEEIYYTGNEYTGTDIFFDGNDDLYLTLSAEIRKVFKHNDTYNRGLIFGDRYNKRTPNYIIKDTIAYTSTDSLNMKGFYIGSGIFIGDVLYFVDRYYHRVAKLTVPSNVAPAIEFIDFPSEIKKGVRNTYKLSFDDSDGFTSVIYCNFDNGEDEKKVLNSTYSKSSSDATYSYITYAKDGDYTISCKAYDNEGAVTTLTKNLTVGDSCNDFSLERAGTQISMKKGSEDWFNLTTCNDVQIFSTDDSIATAVREQSGTIDEVKVTAISSGKATITVSGTGGAGHLFITVEDSAPIPDTKQIVGKLTFLKYEPDGYFGWSDANTFCTEKGYRLPTMDELIYVWNENGGKISPPGFQKDTFYWSSEAVSGTNSHYGCAMDYDCSSSGQWPDVGSIGHPKCFIEGSIPHPTSTKVVAPVIMYLLQ